MNGVRVSRMMLILLLHKSGVMHAEAPRADRKRPANTGTPSHMKQPG